MLLSISAFWSSRRPLRFNSSSPTLFSSVWISAWFLAIPAVFFSISNPLTTVLLKFRSMAVLLAVMSVWFWAINASCASPCSAKAFWFLVSVSKFASASALFLATALAKAYSCEPLTASVESLLIRPAPTLTIWRSFFSLPTETTPFVSDAPANPVRFKLSTVVLLTAVAFLPAVLLPSSTEPFCAFAVFVLEPRIKTFCWSSLTILLEPMATELPPLMMFFLPRATAFSVLAWFSTPAANEPLPVAWLWEPPATVELRPVAWLLSPPPMVEYAPLAWFFLPPAMVELSPSATLIKPPPMVEYAPLASLVSPPPMVDFSPSAVLLEPPPMVEYAPVAWL